MTDGMQAVVAMFLFASAIGAIFYAWIWWGFVAGWRRGRAPRATALLLVALHAAAMLFLGDEPEWHRCLWWTAPLPAAALALAFATRLPLRLLVGAAATAGLCLLPAEPAPLRALPGPIVDLSSAFSHACVVLRGGALVCSGHVDDRCGDVMTALRQGPTRVDDVTDAERVYTALGLRCVGHREGPVTCCGGPLSAAEGPWTLPLDRTPSPLLVTDDQLLARTGDDLHAWPHPLPDGLRSARALAASDAIAVHFAVVDPGGTLWMWRQDDAAALDLARFDGLGDAEEVVVQGRTGACVRRATGAVTCFPWPRDNKPRFEVQGLRAVQLVALDDPFDTFCARTDAGAVVCWTGDEAPAPFAALPTATRLISTSSALCDIAAVVRCVPVSHNIDRPLAELLALPIEPARGW